ncbi:hypothetical protein I4U23_012472 [Adineta vaga]|nr:hypothetical protein I4U23_012472 [Adineta vaga]
MEEPGMRVVRPANTDGTINPNHLIIWLDKHIGKSNQCALLKREFFMISDPTTNCDRELQNKDIDNNICSNDVMPVKVDGVQFVLRTFDDPSKCYEAIKNNQDKYLFFITSGSKGKIIVPQLVSKFQLKLLREHNIYVFCGNMNMTTTPGAEEPTND